MSPPETPRSQPKPAPRGRGFRHAAGLVEARIRAAGEKRGFAIVRLLTHWDEIVGPEAARLARPLKLGWGRGKRSAGLGATLTLATSGAAAPMVQMLAPQIRDRVNAALGHAAVARIVLSQSGSQTGSQMGGTGAAELRPAGFAEPQAGFSAAPGTDRWREAAVTAQAAEVAAGVQDPGLREALEALARNVLSRSDQTKGPTPTCNAP